MNPKAILRLKQMLEAPTEHFDLAEAALLIAAEEYPDLDIAAYLARIEQMAADLKRQLPDDISTVDTLLVLNRYLFREQGFAPNTENYYDPRNSFLNEVMDRKVGIPVTLCILYMEVGRRIGLQLEGVSFPGHFLVKCGIPDGMVVLDPYCGGISLSLDDLQARLRELDEEEVPSKETVLDMLDAAGNREILVRVLRNLKRIYLHYNQLQQALVAAERIIMIMPDLADELRERGMIYLNLECHRAALTDLQRYLILDPLAEDADEIRARVLDLQQLTAKLN
ncbi:MAG: tetratricopeptide repeat protein [Pseudomonadota bacterium]